MSNVFSKLNLARVELQRRELKKSGRNKFANYSYFELGDFLPTVQEIFNNIGLCGVVSYGKEDATLTITDCEGLQSIEVKSPMSSAALKGAHDIQNLGAVQTYLRRYLWVTAMEIVEHDELDATLGAKRTEAAVAAANGATTPPPAVEAAAEASQGRRPYKPGDPVAPAKEETIQRLLEIKLHDMAISPFGISTLLMICKADSLDEIEEGKARQIYQAVNAEMVKRFNAGRNSKNQVVLAPPVPPAKRAGSIDELERAASSLFGDAE